MAYFPAISLSFKESVAFNFGSRPLRYPLVVGRGGLKARRPFMKAVEYLYLSTVHFLLLALLLRAESRREEANVLQLAHNCRAFTWGIHISDL